ncbi:DUF2147 domain-containing protein [Gilvimarinus sp. SDUM040013]|uniref:DUF2147 domain-containing protein n=1 Tax=Gilvimarinus gilvus TaxID=3058038 RepID=A0ABU4RWC1_9GAMM|nr:DUF2147 domain-containing protein [Gilvimarinus sp. SDUM040013]MDO3386599.1 DUF2147 domain-containing protein [Gilvimarinus sp. SDUM040013]MDX6849175.1 DUF2147 domain-containing protein [Gilvimarinus sp. SDUM040013]
MQRFNTKLLALATMGFVSAGLAAPLSAAPIEGTWVTIDDKDRSRKSLVELVVTEEGELRGTITKLLQEKNQGLTCEKCPGDFKDKPVEGLTFMWSLEKASEGEWRDGKILDPKTGKVYKARASLSEDKQELTVRGFVGFSLFGRSQVWVREGD